MPPNLLEIKDLKTHFLTDDGVIKAVDGISLQIGRGETVALVGESGCGKSVTALSIMRLVPSPVTIISGEIRFNGRNLLALSEKEMRGIRGNEISIIFQEPMTSLNPVFTVGDQIMETIILHQDVKRREARRRAIEMLHVVGIKSPTQRIDDYPHQMSGGMMQRVMIAIALACNPSLLIADEPTTALDVTIQAQILELLKQLQKEFHTSILLITHDLGVVAETADHVAVMYAGKIVEYTDVYELFDNPKHPYTVGLFKSLPKLSDDKARLDAIPGTVPNPLELPQGCRFWPRCFMVKDNCKVKEPPLREVSTKHSSACWYAKEVNMEISGSVG